MSISVIIPAYNAEKYLGEAIESALNQTRPAKEIIVVDDASTDRTVEIARGFGERVTVLVNEKNSGPGFSRNAGVAASTGDYLAFLDADDKWLPGHLEDLAGLLDKWPEAGFACCGLQQFGERSASCLQYPECLDAPMNIFPLIMRRDALLPSAAMVRRDVFLEAGGFHHIVEYFGGRLLQVEDYDFFLRLSVDYRCVSSPNCSTTYRVHSNQLSIMRNEQTLLSFKSRVKLLKELKADEAKIPLYRNGFDQMRHAWDGHLRDAWAIYNIKKLRLLVCWGIWQHDLASRCWYYLPRAMMPSWVVRLLRRSKQEKSEAI
jgi:glycosyltransferase involved in cell wall biosynthesis